MLIRSTWRVLWLLLIASGPVMAAQTLQEAVDEVRRETGGKILSAETVRTGKQQVFRIKVLTRDGRVKVMQVVADPVADPDENSRR